MSIHPYLIYMTAVYKIWQIWNLHLIHIFFHKDSVIWLDDQSFFLEVFAVSEWILFVCIPNAIAALQMSKNIIIYLLARFKYEIKWKTVIEQTISSTVKQVHFYFQGFLVFRNHCCRPEPKTSYFMSTHNCEDDGTFRIPLFRKS